MSFKPLNIYILAALGLGGRFAFMELIPDEELARKLIVFWHLLWILLAAISAMVPNRHEPFAIVVKGGVQNVGKYALVLGISLFIYYKWIDVDYFPRRIAELISAANPQGEAELQRAQEGLTQFFTPGMYATISTMGLLLMGTFYALLGTLALKKLPIFSSKN